MGDAHDGPGRDDASRPRPCDCGAAAQAVPLIAQVRSGAADITALADLLVHDGITCAGSADLVPALVALLGSPTVPGAQVLRLLWELTVDPRSVTTLGGRGIEYASVELPDDPTGCADPAANAAAARAALAPYLPRVVAAVTGPAEEVRSSAALVLAAQQEHATQVLAPLWSGLAAQARPDVRSAVLVALAALAGHCDEATRADLRQRLTAQLPASDARARAVAAAGARNAAFPQPPADTVVTALVDAGASGEIDLRPWSRPTSSVRQAGALLLDFPDAHRRLTSAALASDDEDVRADAVADAWRRCCVWRDTHHDLVADLVTLIDDPSDLVVDAVVSRLAWAGSATAAAGDALMAVLNRGTDSRRAQAKALLGLARVGDERCLKVLLEDLRTPTYLNDAAPAVRGMAYAAAELVAAVQAYLGDADAARLEVRTGSVLTAMSGWPQAAPLTAQAVSLAERGVARLPAIRFLGEAAEPAGSVVSLVRGLAAEDDVLDRAAAAWALWKLGECAQGLAALRQMLAGSPAQRRAVLPWLATLTDPPVPLVDAARAHLADDHPSIQLPAAIVIWRSGDGPHALMRVLAAAPRPLPTSVRYALAENLDAVVDAAGATAGAAGRETEVARLYRSRQRITWPGLHDSAVVDDERWRHALRVLLGAGLPS